MIFVLACVSPEEPEDSARAIPELDPPASTPTWGPEDVAAAWTEAMARGWPDAEHAIEVYAELMSHGDTECPGSTEQLDDSLVIGCTAESGYWYSGVATWSVGEGYGGVYNRLHGDFWLETDAGLAYRVGGTAYRLDKGESYTTYLEGTWIWDGDDGPFAGGVSGMAATTVGSVVTVEGALGFDGIAFSADLSVDESSVTGDLSVRDPTHGWHDVTFTGDPCATVTHESGTGEACFDFSALTALLEGA